MEITNAPGNNFIETLSGGGEGVRATVKSETLQDPFATIKLVMPFDSAHDAAFTAGTSMALFAYLTGTDSNSVARYTTICAMNCVIVDTPHDEAGQAKLLKRTVMLECRHNATTTGTLDTPALGVSGLLIGMG